jgi:hypothetical protein
MGDELSSRLEIAANAQSIIDVVADGFLKKRKK